MAARFDLVAPRADALMESLRATGYSLPDVVSDIIDNSITAGARNIWLNFHWAGADSWVSILDDGRGMSELGRWDWKATRRGHWLLAALHSASSWLPPCLRA